MKHIPGCHLIDVHFFFTEKSRWSDEKQIWREDKEKLKWKGEESGRTERWQTEELHYVTKREKLLSGIPFGNCNECAYCLSTRFWIL